MNKEFIPYQQALALKELGFDEPCFGLYHNDKTFYPTQCKSHEQYHGQICLAPLYQQVFRWFREKHRMQYSIQIKDGIWFFEKWSLNGFKTYEEAELACLNKLIEIVKGGEQ